MFKLGLAPFHMWVVNIIENLRPVIIVILTRFQKVVPASMVAQIGQEIGNQIIVYFSILWGCLGSIEAQS